MSTSATPLTDDDLDAQIVLGYGGGGRSKSPLHGRTFTSWEELASQPLPRSEFQQPSRRRVGGKRAANALLRQAGISSRKNRKGHVLWSFLSVFNGECCCMIPTGLEPVFKP